jgi:surfactin synthase thioesterase subunit/NAD(P)-dependent dehydrogenase (short-subunit alcohol dehydrogenase family)/acyl carrier protein
LWGLGLTLTLEHPELACKRIDLDPARPAAETEALVLELLADDREDQIGLRDGHRYGPRLVRGAMPAPTEAKSLRKDGTYLITGGLGGLGLGLATWFAEQGVAQLALVGRRPPSPAARASLDRIEQLGTKVVTLQADVSEPSQVDAVFQQLSGLAPLRGVVHAAVVLDDRTILEQDAERFRKALAPKLLGAWNLHRATASKKLDFFVMYSSAASLLGSPGQANYVAANSALDALAHHRRAAGLPALSINWGAFSEVGSAAAQANRGERLADRGAASIRPELGFSIMDELRRTDAVQVGVMALDVDRWLGFLPPSVASSSFWSELVGTKEGPNGQAGNARASLAALPTERRTAALVEQILADVARVLRQDRSRLDAATPFSASGMDSLMSLELRNRLEASLGIPLSATMLFSYPDPNALAGHLTERFGNETSAAASEVPAATTPTPWIAFSRRGERSRVKVFCLPGAGASSSFFRPWLEHTPAELELLAIEFPAKGARLLEPHPGRIDAIVPQLLEALLPQLGESFAFFAHSMASLVAFELTRALRRMGRSPRHLFVSSFVAPNRNLMSPIGLDYGDREFLELARSKGFISADIDRAHDEEIQRVFLPPLRKDVAMLETYQYVEEAPLAIPLTVFGGADDTMVPPNKLDAWQQHTSSTFTSRILAGDHFFARNAGQVLLEHIRQALELAPGETEPGVTG